MQIRSFAKAVERVSDVVRRMLAHTGGNYALMFALSLLPITASVGAAVDMSRALLVKARLSQALDAAGLAVGGMTGLSETQAIAVANSYFNANYPVHEIGTPGTLSVRVTDQTVTLSAAANLETSVLAAVGIDQISVSMATEITRESKGLEVVMVLDNTGSMNSNGKIGALREAAGELVDILFGSQAHPEKLKAALVPFVTSVNIKGQGFSMDWMDTTAESPYHGSNFEPTNEGTRHNHFDLFDGITNAAWKGCVEARPAPYDTDDTPPNPGIPATRWVPYFWPDEPDTSYSYSNNYMYDRKRGDEENRQRSTRKYQNRSGSIDEYPSTTYGPNKSCPQPVVPLTNDRDHLLQEINAMRAWNNSGTNIPLGLVWGWRVLSPASPYTEGTSYTDPEVTKALILLTDGDNVVVSQNTHNRSDYTGYGYLDQQRLGTDSVYWAEQRLNEKVSELCGRIKAEGVRVYTITFQLNSSSLTQIFRSCASNPDLYFNSPSNEELRLAFQAIAKDLSNLRISR